MLNVIERQGYKKVKYMNKELRMIPYTNLMRLSNILTRTRNENKAVCVGTANGMTRMYKFKKDMTILDVIKTQPKVPLIGLLAKFNYQYVFELTIDELVTCKDIFKKRDKESLVNDILFDNSLLCEKVEAYVDELTKKYINNKYEDLIRWHMLKKEYKDIDKK